MKISRTKPRTSDAVHVSESNSHVSNLKAALNNFKLSTWKSRQELARIYPSSFQTLGIVVNIETVTLPVTYFNFNIRLLQIFSYTLRCKITF